MKKFGCVCATLLLALLSSSCISGKIDYRPPTTPSQPNQTSMLFNKSKDEIWKTLIKNVGSSFFVINNMDKESGFINLSYSGGNTCDFIECGTHISEVTNARGHRVHQFEGCTDFKQYEVINNGNLYFVDRTMKLEGRINIVVQSEDPDSTQMNVNTRYVVTKAADFYNSTRNKVSSPIETANFDSNGMGRFPKSNTMCRATGVLEKMIFDMVQP